MRISQLSISTFVAIIFFFDDVTDRYTVEWDTNAGKKKSKGYTRDSRKARMKADNLRLWGTGDPIEITNHSTASAEKPMDTPTTAANPPAPPSPAETAASGGEAPLPATKCCAVCHKEHDLGAKDKKPVRHVVLPCAHIFCNDCCGGNFLPDPSSDVEVRSCRVCNKYDPSIMAFEVLPYIQELRDPPQALLEAMYKEYSLMLTCESVEAMETQQQRELDAFESQKNQAIKAGKDAMSNDKKGGSDKDKKGKLVKQILARYGHLRYYLSSLSFRFI